MQRFLIYKSDLDNVYVNFAIAGLDKHVHIYVIIYPLFSGSFQLILHDDRQLYLSDIHQLNSFGIFNFDYECKVADWNFKQFLSRAKEFFNTLKKSQIDVFKTSIDKE